ncbi:MAG: hypothetical protein QOK49_1413, partial [Baekduia sp.]|nr:hypothetical protein [Baekduia sp.]
MSDRRRIAYPVLLVGFGLVAWSFWPGLLTPDSNQTIYQAGADFSSDWWTAFGAIVLRWWLDLQLGLGTVYGLGIALNVIGLYLCCRAAFRRLPAAAATVAFTTFPPMAAQLSGLSRDTFFLGFSLCAFGCFGAMLRPTTRQRRRQLVFAGLLLAFLGFLCRQNGIVVVLVLAGLAVAQGELRWLAWLRPLRGRRTAIVTGAVAACLLAFIASQLIYTVAGTKRVHPERVIYLYDLASIST